MTATALQLYGESASAHPLSITQLRRWLDGSWALLFSHADDFAAYGFEADRWLAHVREAFACTRVRPLARLSSPCNDNAGWVTEVGGWCATNAHVDEIRRRLLRETMLDRAEGAWLWNPKERFVLLLDDSLRARWSLTYRAGTRLPSPIELAAMAESMRLAPTTHARSTPPHVARGRSRPTGAAGGR